jgi:predicted transcriptional regulator
MTPTSLRLPEDLKRRVESLAASAGQSTHAYLVDAIATFTAAAVKRREFIAAATASREKTRRTGKAYLAKDVHRYFRDRAAGKNPARPKPVKWR